MDQIKKYIDNLGISSLNAMQEEVNAQFDSARDFILLSPTGSGKTLAFSILLLKLLKNYPKTIGSALILVPTRELALQIESVIKKMDNTISMVCLYGGNNSKLEKNKIKEGPQVIVATPGRLIYHLEREPGLLQHTHTLVLDEFDKSLELGFYDQISYIIHACRDIKHKILTSATDVTDKPEFVKLNNPIKLDFLEKTALIPNLNYFRVNSSTKLKLEQLFKLICKIGAERILVFCNHREATEHVSSLLESKGIDSIPYHGGLDQYFRELAITKIKNGSQLILITTDLASRGLDIPDMNHVIHYQFPYKQEDFIHRNGRSGRNQQEGNVYSVIAEGDRCPEYYEHVEELELDEFYPLPPLPAYQTIRFTAGKKQKINKIDIVGFIFSLGTYQKSDVGMVEVKAFDSYVAVNRSIAREIVKLGNNAKIKGQKVRLSLI
ncbi:DEAD/DEAH box helicase [Sphingobacterium sp. HJSM2_6]|uniref:DEAD/DEAH box helicase n=1 Tax=Sphingobacterium sp. HJSM2_6 TaxID=3366264 RepID=UPI003BBDC396